MNQISVLRHRYPGRTVGWSTHEDPDDTLPIAIAVAKGARIFERHVGVETDEVKLNAYSSTPEQLDAWLSAYHVARELCGSSEWPERSKPERESIDSLRRGVYVRKPIKENQAIDRSQVYFAMPYLEGQLESGEWRDGILSARDFSPDAPLLREQVTLPEPSDVLVLKHAVHEVKALLHEARIPLDSSFKVEYSHHYGVQRFREVGAVIIECMNREYCKKLIVQLPRQRHPSHFHTLKEETFQVLYGDLHVDLDGMHHHLVPGQTLLVQPGVWHSFRTDSGVVFEEISTTHHSNDSTYRDKAINQLASSERKTRVDHWGRFQLDEILG
jgi:N-acetylneuraminate synthase